jgi:hypothetical protein
MEAQDFFDTNWDRMVSSDFPYHHSAMAKYLFDTENYNKEIDRKPLKNWYDLDILYSNFRKAYEHCNKYLKQFYDVINKWSDYVDEGLKFWFEEEKEKDEDDRLKKYKDFDEFRNSDKYNKYYEDEDQMQWEMFQEDEYNLEIIEAIKHAKEWNFRDEYDLARKIGNYQDDLKEIMDKLVDFLNKAKIPVITLIFDEEQEFEDIEV